MVLRRAGPGLPSPEPNTLMPRTVSRTNTDLAGQATVQREYLKIHRGFNSSSGGTGPMWNPIVPFAIVEDPPSRLARIQSSSTAWLALKDTTDPRGSQNDFKGNVYLPRALTRLNSYKESVCTPHAYRQAGHTIPRTPRFRPR